MIVCTHHSLKTCIKPLQPNRLHAFYDNTITVFITWYVLYYTLNDIPTERVNKLKLGVKSYAF